MPTSKPTCALVVLFTMSGACASNQEPAATTATVVSDTLGYRYSVDCSQGLCYLTSLDGIVAKSCAGGNGTEAFVLVPDPLLSIFAVLTSSYGGIQLSAANPARPVACKSDADCVPAGVPVGAGTCSFACRNGLCRTTSAACTPTDGNPLLTYDVLTLCQADIPWPSVCPYITSQPFASRIAEVAEVCGAHGTCATVPADCRQLEVAVPSGIDGGVVPATGIDGGV